MPKTYAEEKPQDRKKVLRRLWGYLARYKWMAAAAAVLTILSNLFGLLGPMLSGGAIDAIGSTAGGVDFPAVFFYCALMLAFYAASAVLSYLLATLMIRLSQRVVYQMREDVFNRLLDLPIQYFDAHQTGDLVSRISYDIDTVNASLSSDLLQIAASVITVVGSLAMMLMISPWLVLIFVVTIPISVLFTRHMTRKVRPLFRARSRKLGELNGFVEEIISGQKTVKAYHQEETMINRFDQRNQEAVDAFFKADYHGSMVGPSINFINNLSLALISVFGALLFLSGRLSLGRLSSFVLYSRRFSGPINEMANIVSELQSACAAAERVFRLIDEEAEPPDRPDAAVLLDTRGHVEMRCVRFGYDPQTPVIHDLRLDAQPGSLVAVVGPTGAGKTTLINLLMRFYDPQGGEIRLDGTPISGLTRKSLRLAYAMVLQDTWLFHGTVYENIAYGKRGASREEVVRAAQAARIHHDIMRLPNGYETILDENGVNISQGQKQLITIARAMLLDANMLILDEATSHVDTRTELRIQEAMRVLMRGKTCFVIAHRLSTIQNADTILVVQDGEIAEQGSHAALMRLGGIYAGMYQSQYH